MLILKKAIDSLKSEEMTLWLSRIPEKKRNEIMAFRNIDDRKRSVCGYILAVEGLGEFLGSDENEITIAYSENGKPVFDGAFLSIAHAGNFAVCAVSGNPVGIDAEVFRRISPKAALRFCTKNELLYIFGNDFDGEIPQKADEDVTLRFLEIWTKKEAYGKMLGCGTLYDMKNTDVSHVKTMRDGDLIISVTEKEK
ncbi:MAG: 4'-phosphopantetheinyl transferase family protein [Acutalibacteraceae bacterium]